MDQIPCRQCSHQCQTCRYQNRNRNHIPLPAPCNRTPLACPRSMPPQQKLLFHSHLPHRSNRLKASQYNITCYLQPAVSHQRLFCIDPHYTLPSLRRLRTPYEAMQSRQTNLRCAPNNMLHMTTSALSLPAAPGENAFTPLSSMLPAAQPTRQTTHSARSALSTSPLLLIPPNQPHKMRPWNARSNPTYM
jgi:hypothetical protein